MTPLDYTFNGGQPSLEWIDVSLIQRAEGTQRNLNPTRARTMEGAFVFPAMGVVTVSKRADGSYHLVDGQHRVEALLIRRTRMKDAVRVMRERLSLLEGIPVEITPDPAESLLGKAA